jgi:peptide/nickel transport system substrate-binding protein
LRPVLIFLALAAAACAGQAPRSSPTAVPLRIALSDRIPSLDPNHEVETVTDSALFNVYEPLVGYDDKLGIRTMLAESWEHPLPEQWRFRLRQGVRFHDGTPLTAPLVRDALLALKKASEHEAAEFLGQVTDVVAVDDRTLDLITAEPRALLSSLGVVYVTKKNASGAFPPLVGTGPYRIVSHEGGELHVARSPDYWGPAAEFQDVSFVSVPDPVERVLRLERNAADIAYGIPPALADLRAAKIVRRPGVTLFYIGLNMRDRPDNPLRRKRVREALHVAIDRKRIVDEALRGMGTVASQPAPSSVFGFNPEVAAPAPDPQRARELLRDAGYPKGMRLVLDSDPGSAPAVDLVARDFRAIGVQVEVREAPRAEVWRRAKAGESQAYLVQWNFSSGEASEFFEYCIHTANDRYGFFNYGGYSNPKVDAVAEQNAAILDPTERRNRLQGALALVMEDLPVLPLFVTDDIYGVRPGIQFKPRADGEIWLPDVHLAR